MKVQLESTKKLVTLVINGVDVPARLWQGVTEGGIECHAYVTRIAVARSLDAAEFDAELQEQAAPRVGLEAIPLRLIL